MAEIELPNPHEAKERAEDPFTKMVALSVAIYAVVLAIAAAGGNNAGKDMLMEQQKASNKWAQYQSKAIREALYINESERIERDLEGGGNMINMEAKAKAEKSLARIKGKLDEYKTEKSEIMKEAQTHEHLRDDSHTRDPYFDFAEVLLQISIVLASVAMLSGKRWAFYASIALALLGLALTANGYLLFDGGKLFGSAAGH